MIMQVLFSPSIQNLSLCLLMRNELTVVGIERGGAVANRPGEGKWNAGGCIQIGENLLIVCGPENCEGPIVRDGKSPIDKYRIIFVVVTTRRSLQNHLSFSTQK
jgi:hypothetical protein